ncbi:hypothetical protein FT643_11800 [Ketobacter sp. MCCC 1A13808]|uniref:hypothetical protein n=1 Tax=Ketobacter sp. MCCC 1A13808 TaxID=2602738 RepID=UPI000F138B7F|nr:hypothetical protein [Ketobacter sp. MCCC 1A13808]MVF12824.1 hypothetical protein [Ketobacter sp. MCCC 1A13808]RLP54502.1 MAG: hypothetical protein D6160_10760 [Ketobacter sp.]
MKDPTENVDAMAVLRLFEADVTGRRYEQAEECLSWLTKNCSIHAAQPNKVILPTFDEREVVYVATRMASSLCQLFSDPGFGISDKKFSHYALGHGSLITLLGVSGFGNADHVIQNLLEPLENRKRESVSRETFNKILLLHSIDSEVKLPYSQYLQSHPRHILWLVLLAVASLFCVTERENSARNQLISSMMQGFDISAFETPMLGWLCIAWMHCSYATIPERDQFKKLLNRMLVYWMKGIGIEQYQMAKQHQKRNKPVLLVINEFFKSSHAMYRCYAPTIMALREHFYVIGMTQEKDCDEVSVKCFDEHEYIEWREHVGDFLDKTINTIKNISPDAIYYPSVGMQITSILLANIRLAPCQFMTLGHPASSHSDVMDYCLNENQFLGDSKLFSEKLRIVDDNASNFSPHIDQPPRSELLGWKKPLQSGEPVRIIITGSAMKINAEFVSVLSTIETKTVSEVEFHFIPNLNNLSICLFRKKLASMLKRFVVHPSMGYQQYLRLVARCQIHLSPFPFGSTNSLVDSMLLGLPLVVMKTENCALQIDAGIIGKLQLEELTPAASNDEYINQACRLIDNQDARERLTHMVEEADIEKIYFEIRPAEAERCAQKILEMVLYHEPDAIKFAQ